MATATAQMNIRLDASVKARGDEAIVAAGMTPTQLLRTLWEGIAQSDNGCELVERLVEVASGVEPSSAKGLASTSKTSLAAQGANYIVDSLKAYGLTVDALPGEGEWEELTDEVDAERFGACGL